MGKLSVGTVKTDITPPVGTPMAGYAGRDHGAEGVHDNLFARVVVLDDGNTQAVIVSCDLIDICREGLVVLEELVADSTGLPPEALFVAHSHTHSGPTTAYGEDAENRTYLDNLYALIAGAIFEARECLVPARFSTAERPVQCGVNRRERKPDGRIVLGVNPEGPVDRRTDILRFDAAEDGRPLAVLFRHACHGVVMGPDNYLISADWPGPAEAFVERNTGALAGFLNGCCGDINAHPRLKFEYVDLLGTRLGAAVVQGLTEASESVENVTLRCQRHDCTLPVDPVPALPDAERELGEARAALELVQAGKAKGELSLWAAERAVRFAEARRELAESGEQDVGLPFPISLIALNDVALVGYPAEVFFEIGEAVRQGSPFATTLTCTHVNGAVGYIPVREAFEEGGYEINARATHRGLGLSPDAAEALTEESLRALNELRAAN